MGGIASEPRYHVVLIPGFGGFDALGQLEYYFGVTPVFHAIRTARQNLVLHYFDNLPTAAVVTRAARLQRYLAKRIARGEIRPGDEVTLVGHSTGGLDIRQLISDLHKCPDEPRTVDGGVSVTPSCVRGYLRRVVFLSVPHWGTNIADWVRRYPIGRQAVIAKLRAAVAGSQVPLLNHFEHLLTSSTATLVGGDLFQAIKDALLEADPGYGPSSPERTAEAHEAEAALSLYLRHISSNFHVIDDLVSKRLAGSPVTPAHFGPRDRSEELKRWDGGRHPPIETLSYVTVSDSPFAFKPGRPAPEWDLTNPCTYPEVAKDKELSKDTDLVYRVCYRACAGGPFRMPRQDVPVKRHIGRGVNRIVEVWDNDGIVNTASMFWPRGENVVVESDHMDIVGHRPFNTGEGAPRTTGAYDLLKSVPRFADETFHQVWSEIFEFSAGGSKSPKTKRRAAAGAYR